MPKNLIVLLADIFFEFGFNFCARWDTELFLSVNCWGKTFCIQLPSRSLVSVDSDREWSNEEWGEGDALLCSDSWGTFSFLYSKLPPETAMLVEHYNIKYSTLYFVRETVDLILLQRLHRQPNFLFRLQFYIIKRFQVWHRYELYNIYCANKPKLPKA